MLNGDYSRKSKVSKSSKQDAIDHRQVDGIHGESTANEPKTEAAAALVSTNPASSEASQLPKV